MPLRLPRRELARGLAAIGRCGRLALLLAALFGFCWQTSLVQTHIHLASEAGASGPGAGVSSQPSASAERHKSPLPCPFCRELIHAGHYLPGAPPTIPSVIIGLGFAPPPFNALFENPRQRSHSWYGRGPPASTLSD